MPGYKYSAALQNSSIVWSEDTLQPFLLKPSAVIPGNKMNFNGLKREGEMANLIAYLKSAAK